MALTGTCPATAPAAVGDATAVAAAERRPIPTAAHAAQSHFASNSRLVQLLPGVRRCQPRLYTPSPTVSTRTPARLVPVHRYQGDRRMTADHPNGAISGDRSAVVCARVPSLSPVNRPPPPPPFRRLHQASQSRSVGYYSVYLPSTTGCRRRIIENLRRLVLR